MLERNRLKSLKRMRKQRLLLSTRQQRHTAESIGDKVSEIRAMFPERGSDGICKELLSRYVCGFHDTQVNWSCKTYISRLNDFSQVVSAHLKETDPDAVMIRYRRRFE